MLIKILINLISVLFLVSCSDYDNYSNSNNEENDEIIKQQENEIIKLMDNLNEISQENEIIKLELKDYKDKERLITIYSSEVEFLLSQNRELNSILYQLKYDKVDEAINVVLKNGFNFYTIENEEFEPNIIVKEINNKYSNSGVLIKYYYLFEGSMFLNGRIIQEDTGLFLLIDNNNIEYVPHLYYKNELKLYIINKDEILLNYKESILKKEEIEIEITKIEYYGIIGGEEVIFCEILIER